MNCQLSHRADTNFGMINNEDNDWTFYAVYGPRMVRILTLLSVLLSFSLTFNKKFNYSHFTCKYLPIDLYYVRYFSGIVNPFSFVPRLILVELTSKECKVF